MSLKYKKIFNSTDEAIGTTQITPFVATVKDSTKVLYANNNAFGAFFDIESDGSGFIRPKGTIPPSNKLYYETNDKNIITPNTMSPTSNIYSDYGVMTFANTLSEITASAFQSQTTLTTINGGSEITNIGNYAFNCCSSLTTVSFPNCTSIDTNAFKGCTSLTTASFPNCINIGSYALYGCDKLTTLYLNSVTSVTSLPYSSAFSNCSKLTSIYVPASLVESFRTATNWTYFSSKIVAWNG